jgi:hypothetical protein
LSGSRSYCSQPRKDSRPLLSYLLKHLEGLTELRQLWLFGLEIGDQGIKSLKDLVRLEVLDLGETRITNFGISHLKRLANLRELTLFGTKIGDAGLRHLRTLAHLQRLDLGLTTVTSDGVRDLQRALPNAKIVGPLGP